MSKAWWMSLAAGCVVGCAGEMQETDPVLEALRAPPKGSARYGMFGGHTPCDEPCEKLKVAITLHEDAVDGTPTTFLLERVFVADGNIRHVSEGTWELLPAPDWFPQATVLKTTDEASPNSILPEDTDRLATPGDFSIWMILRDNVLVLLDDELEPRVGDGSESWTLDRVE